MNNLKIWTVSLIIGTIFFASCSKDDNSNVESMSDIEGNQYKVVKIGTQCWMTENLRTTTYVDGSPIENFIDNDSWSANSAGGYCWYENNNEYKNEFGALYNWKTVESGKLCPEGWHVPSDYEWGILLDYLKSEGHGDSEGKVLKTSAGWNEDGNGTDLYGFSAKPTGIRRYNGDFLRLGEKGNWWSSTLHESRMIWYRSIQYDNDFVSKYDGSDSFGFSVRCTKFEQNE